MTVQVKVTTTLVGHEVEIELATASFGHVADPPEVQDDDAVERSPIDRVLAGESSMLAPGLSLQLA